MNPQEVTQLIALGLDVAERLAKVVMQIKAQQGLSDEEILAAAESKDADTRARAEKFLASLKG
jgi:hypothetical protein